MGSKSFWKRKFTLARKEAIYIRLMNTREWLILNSQSLLNDVHRPFIKDITTNIMYYLSWRNQRSETLTPVYAWRQKPGLDLSVIRILRKNSWKIFKNRQMCKIIRILLLHVNVFLKNIILMIIFYHFLF